MLHGVLNGPIFAADIVAVLQLKSASREASRRIYADEKQIKWAHAEIDRLNIMLASIEKIASHLAKDKAIMYVITEGKL
jgi:hypothetical protein